jgi:uncharacterized protein (DUF433 family)
VIIEHSAIAARRGQADPTAEQILADYPDLERDDLRAVYAYAARLSRVQRIDPAVA